ncbi:MAG TPA: hypothetical protein VGI40_06250 [Pirellulaceae bacterium]|jgi:hypothetical protein
MFRITIRELLWLTTIAALAIGWLIHTRSEQTNDQFLQIQLMEQRLHEASELVTQLQSISKNKLEGGTRQTE